MDAPPIIQDPVLYEEDTKMKSFAETAVISSATALRKTSEKRERYN